MPTYEYRCTEGHEFEQFQRMNDPPIEKCPVCGAAAVRQLSAGAGLLFKGSGFYITDYRSESYKKAAEADSGKPAGDTSKPAAETKAGAAGKSESKAESKSESKSEAKPASKPEPKPKPPSAGE